MLLVHILRHGTPLFPAFPENKIPALLRARSILPSDHFWHDGMAEWVLVADRWTAEPEPAPAPAAVVTSLPAFATYPAATPANAAPAPIPRRLRPSLLHEAQKRYHETLAPWGGTTPATPPA